MADDWIKIRVALTTHPKVVRIMSALKADRFRVLGGLQMMWGIFDTHTEDGELPGYSPETLDEILGWKGFSEAVISVGWLQDVQDKLIAPEFETHNGVSAKRRANDAVRKASARKADIPQTKQGPEKEKRRVKTPIVPKGDIPEALLRARGLFRTRHSTPLDSSQINGWKKNKEAVEATTEDDWRALEWWFLQPTEKNDAAEFRRTSLGTLLNHWNDEITKARRAAVKDGVSFVGEKKRAVVAPEDWQRIIGESYPEMHLPSEFGELPESVRHWVLEKAAEKKKGGANE